MKYHHLTTDERCKIYTLKSTGKKQNEIAKYLNVSASTICRELKRNRGKKGYRYKLADAKAIERRHVASCVPEKMTIPIIRLVENKLLKKWSPEQILGVLRSRGIFISYESIYGHIWANKKAGVTLYSHLRRRGKKYNRRGAKTAGRGCIPNRVDILLRPKIIEKKPPRRLGRRYNYWRKTTRRDSESC